MNGIYWNNCALINFDIVLLTSIWLLLFSWNMITNNWNIHHLLHEHMRSIIISTPTKNVFLSRFFFNYFIFWLIMMMGNNDAKNLSLSHFLISFLVVCFSSSFFFVASFQSIKFQWSTLSQAIFSLEVGKFASIFASQHRQKDILQFESIEINSA